jgi:hypothetical protein
MRPRDQGTRFESWLVKRFREAGLSAGRLPEGGSRDAGDVIVELPSGDSVIMEAKARANLNPHVALAKARIKAAKADLDVLPWLTVLAWKRLTRKEGNVRRTPSGEPVIVSMTFDDFLELLRGERDDEDV